jgi:hypothetical protein
MIYSVGLMSSAMAVYYGSLRGDGYAFIESFDIVYRRPEDRSESVVSYEQRVNVSTSDSGDPDYRNLLYYYNRTYASYGDSLAFTASTDSTNPSVKFTSKSVKDVVLEYEYSDITGTRFAYNEDIRPESNPANSYDVYGVLSYQPEISIHNKSRTLVANAHVDDCPQWLSDGNANSEPVAGNENSSCSASAGSGFDRAGDQVLNEDLQECLYNDSQSLVLGNFDTVYEWFWHPDEILFWYSVGVDVSKFSTTLTLSSTIPKIKRLFEHEDYGCNSNMAAPYYDGTVHKLPTWQPVGHIIYAGNPLFNDACWDVVVHKIGKHLGEITYGTENYGDISFGWPYEAPKDKASYIARGLVDKKGTYYGGSIGGIFGGSEYVGQLGAQDYYGQAQSTTAAEEVEEEAAVIRAKAVRADASRSGVHQPE